jgi:8-oxo-dGTP diphosphatase
MAASKALLKVGLAMIKEDHLLVVRKRGTKTFILPGGKPEGREKDLEALRRELQEELGCTLTKARFEGAFTDTAADLLNTVVTVRLYAGILSGEPRPASEIEELAWVSLCAPSDLPLAPSITNKILPYLCARRGVPPAEERRRVTSRRSARPVHP